MNYGYKSRSTLPKLNYSVQNEIYTEYNVRVSVTNDQNEHRNVHRRNKSESTYNTSRTSQHNMHEDNGSYI